ncbi:MAG TPA: HU family DNA-binding protein [Candidatus Babeliales bacterium]|nr:HU family DNA-binding protein [Candidatus Babeliales bacterium]
MNKAQLVDSIAKMTKEQKSTVKNVIEAFVDVVGQSLKQNKNVIITGFGSFKVLKRKARTGVNPSTKKKMQIPARRVPKFNPGKALREMVQ